MDQLRRWREERAAARRRLRLESRPDLAQVPPLSRADRRRQKSPSYGIHWGPQAPVVTPVHPEWDDPFGRRLRTGLILSLVFHAVLIPALVLLPKFDRMNLSRDRQTIDRSIAVVIAPSLPPVKGQGGRGLRPVETAPAKKNTNSRPKAPRVKPAPAPARKPNSPEPKPPREFDPAQSRPEAVADAAPKRPASTTRPRVETPAMPAISDDVVAGPLLAGRGPVPGSEASIGGLEGVDFPYNYYLELVRSKIAGAWRIPNGLVARGQRIEAQITFRIMRDGTVTQGVIEIPSGSAVYDQAGQRAVLEGRPYPPLPPAFAGEFLTVHFQFTYVGR